VFTSRFGARLSDRLLVPLGLPVAVFVLVLVITLSLSRILLAVSEQGSRIVAMCFALVILGGAFFVASRERMARAALSVLCAVAFVALAGAGAAGLAHGERHFERKGGVGAASGPATAVATVDNDLAFDVSTLDLPAGRPALITFTNQSTGISHNIGIYNQKGGTELFQGKILVGPASVTYTVPALAPGTYYFQCDVHPQQMFGNVTVAAPGAASAASSTTTAPPPAPTTTEAVKTGLATTPPTAGP
jgi:plastocyanin